MANQSEHKVLFNRDLSGRFLLSKNVTDTEQKRYLTEKRYGYRTKKVSD